TSPDQYSNIDLAWMRPLETSSAAKNHRLPNPLHPKCFYTLWAVLCRSWFRIVLLKAGQLNAMTHIFSFP
ncbi:hypothetical protein, partial [Pseudomonas fluorescens]|uniref:hypothetical protein n=1 Tax=Pseudomonas fluorescens TaxID=294 RepID=UPI001CD37BA4